jgi:hypothetical protein
MTRTNWVILSVLAASLLLGVTALAQGALTIPWSAIAGGGGSGAAGHVALDSVVGQWTAASGASGNAQVGSGFWGGGGAEVGRVYPHARFLPLVMGQ